MKNLDRIERQMTFEVSREEVWAAITEADQLSRWFGSHAELDLRPGGHGAIRWEELDITTAITVDAVEPPERFAYRWEPGGANEEGPTTLVEFTLEEIPGGTRLTLVESGFAAFPPESRRGNEFGWDEELAELRDLLVGSRV